jgi:hypothetical protein
VIEEVVRRFPADVAASAIPADEARIDETIAFLQQFHHVDVAVAWLVRVIDRSPDHPHPCDLLYALAMPTGDARIVALANKHCRETESTHEVRLALARSLLANHHDDEVIGLLVDVEDWGGRVDDKVNAWLLLCDARHDKRTWDEAKHCLRRLDASGTLSGDRIADVAARLVAIDRERAVAEPAPK